MRTQASVCEQAWALGVKSQAQEAAVGREPPSSGEGRIPGDPC